MKLLNLRILLPVILVALALTGCEGTTFQTMDLNEPDSVVSSGNDKAETDVKSLPQGSSNENVSQGSTPESVGAMDMNETGLPDEVSVLVYSENSNGLTLSLMMVGDSPERYIMDGSYAVRHFDEDSCKWSDIEEIGTGSRTYGNHTLDNIRRVEANVDWESRYGSLNPGLYRFVSSFEDVTDGHKYIYGENFMLLESEDRGEELPDYSYPGNDAMEKAISAYFLKNGSRFDLFGYSIDVVSPVIFKTEEKEGETLVWGTFWDVILRKQGKVLYNIAGGENTGLLHMQKTSDGYEVTAFDAVEDGSEYDPSWKKICDGDETVYYELSSEETRIKLDEKTRELVSTYSSANNLGITTIYYTGQEPVVVN